MTAPMSGGGAFSFGFPNIRFILVRVYYKVLIRTKINFVHTYCYCYKRKPIDQNIEITLKIGRVKLTIAEHNNNNINDKT